MEAYGGAITGIVGVYRDPMGTGKGSRIIAGMYGYCVGPRDYSGPLRPHLHPRRLLDGVIEGVRDGGNKSGVPTPFGNVFFHESFLGKCLVFVAPNEAESLLRTMKKHALGKDSRIIGEVTQDKPGRVLLGTKIGGTRIVPMLTGEQLPRIC